MIPHPRHYLEHLDDVGLTAVHDAALRVLAGTGIVVESAVILEQLAAAGCAVDRGPQRARFRAEQVAEAVARAPATWTWHARNPERSVVVGAAHLLVAPGYGSPFIADVGGKQRPATLEDFANFATLAGQSDVVDISGGLLVEPTDTPMNLRALETTRCLLTRSDKPLMGAVSSPEAARDSLALMRLVHADLEQCPCLLGLININSPLRLDRRMAEALWEYVQAGQPVLFTPGILLGMTAPVTLAGALTQCWAELLAAVTIVQTLRPGQPLIVGTGGFGADLRTGAGGFGRPENALGIILGAQVARRLGLPFRCSAGVSSSRRPDCRSGYERMLTAQAAWNAGAHFCLQGLGILDNINAMSYEQFIIDTEIWAYLARLARPVTVDAETLALDLVAQEQPDYMSQPHTVAHMRREILEPKLIPPESFEAWWAGGARDVVQCAALQLERRLVGSHPPAMDAALRREIDRYVELRRTRLATGKPPASTVVQPPQARTP